MKIFMYLLQKSTLAFTVASALILASCQQGGDNSRVSNDLIDNFKPRTGDNMSDEELKQLVAQLNDFNLMDLSVLSFDTEESSEYRDEEMAKLSPKQITFLSMVQDTCDVQKIEINEEPEGTPEKENHYGTNKFIKEKEGLSCPVSLTEHNKSISTRTNELDDEIQMYSDRTTNISETLAQTLDAQNSLRYKSLKKSYLSQSERRFQSSWNPEEEDNDVLLEYNNNKYTFTFELTTQDNSSLKLISEGQSLRDMTADKDIEIDAGHTTLYWQGRIPVISTYRKKVDGKLVKDKAYLSGREIDPSILTNK